MTALCKAMGRRKQKEEIVPDSAQLLRGRMTGSDSIDTLVQVGLTNSAGLRQAARRVILQDFTACVQDELTVRQGDTVYILYRDHDWFYVTTPGGRKGYIPVSFCARRKSSPVGRPTHLAGSTDVDQNEIVTGLIRGPSHCLLANGASRSASSSGLDHYADRTRPLPSYQELCDANRIRQWPKTKKPRRQLIGQGFNETSLFVKADQGRSLVLFDFVARNENDLNVRRGEIVQCLNIEDREWVWVKRGDDQQGFVPYTYLCPLNQ